jgi:glycosyltransferase involved in cell wall biosynthesis
MSEPEGRGGSSTRAVGDRRTDAVRVQHEALPDGPTVVSSTGPYGSGGLGRHLAELVEALRGTGGLAAYLTPQPHAQDAGRCGIEVGVPRPASAALALPPVRFAPGWRVLLTNAAFDSAAARRLPPCAEHLLVFNGHALRHVDAARRLGYRSVALVSANAHMAHEARQHREAWRRHPLERPWAPRNRRRNMAEYAAVDHVYVSSEYAWETFVSEGFPEERLRMFPLTPHHRFQPRRSPPTAATFNVVYIGSLSVHKGVPLLIEAVRRLAHDDLRLLLVGGSGTRGMRRHIESACRADPRLSVQPGDPLAHLHDAALCVHPSYVDGFAYAPAEALACGVPVIVTEDTGMKESIEPGRNGLILPTGDVDALTQAIEAAYSGEVLGG